MGPARPGAREPGGREGRRPAVSTTYRNAALAALQPEELPVAEQLLKGGIPGVRQAIEEQNARARSDGRPEVTEAPLMAMAERLLPVVNLASWKDRASVARNSGKEVSLRELRSIVASASTVTLDEEGRDMAAALRTALDQRVTALRAGWVTRISSALDADRVLDAVRASVRPPEPAARLSAELAVRLSTAAGAAMASDTPADQWLTLLGVVIDSPVRRTVKPAGLPAGADESVLAEARKAAGYVPELARLLGIPIPPPPGPRRPGPGPGRWSAPSLLTAHSGGPPPSRSVQGPVHGQEAGLEPGPFVEILGRPVTGEGGPVDSCAPLCRHPGQASVEQQSTEAHTASRRFDEAHVQEPAWTIAVALLDVGQGEGADQAVEGPDPGAIPGCRRPGQPSAQVVADRFIPAGCDHLGGTPLGSGGRHHLAGQLGQPGPVAVGCRPHRFHVHSPSRRTPDWPAASAMVSRRAPRAAGRHG